METKDIIERVINEWDPIELLAFCPKDEYSSEIYTIQVRSREINDELTLALVIYNVFTKSFDDAFKCSMEDCRVVARTILSEKSE